MKQFYKKDLCELQSIVSSKGNQEKWTNKSGTLFIKGQFLYQGKGWKDYMVEAAASFIGSQIRNTRIEVLQQEVCKIDESYGVYSRNFKMFEDEECITYARLLKASGRSFPENEMPGKKFQRIMQDFKDLTGLDLTKYLITMIIIDTLVGNEDRHLNNICIGQRGKFFFKIPLFDFGLGWFEHDKRYENLNVQQAIDLMECKPFHSNPFAMINWLKRQYDIKKYLPEKLIMHREFFPSGLAEDYFKLACDEIGVDYEIREGVTTL